MQSISPEANLRFSRTEIVEVGNARLACHRHGQGPAIICLHAIGQGARDFVKLAHTLEDSFEFIALDWPGHGDTPDDNGEVSANQYVHLLGGVVDTLGLQNYFILGNSIGGAVAIIHASQRSGHVQGLILCNPAGLQPVNLLARLYCRHMARKFAKGEQGDAGFAAKFRRYYEKTILKEPDAIWRRNEIIATGYEVAPTLRKAWEGFANPEADIRALIPKLTMPVLYAWARSDQAVAWGRSKRAALSAPDHEVKLFKGGHCAFLESPEAFCNKLTQFTNRVRKI